jgi:hypothetical protein
LFAQTYTLDPRKATDLREQNISDAISRTIKREILDRLERLMRENPYGETFATAGEKIAARENNGEQIPEFQVCLLRRFTDRLFYRLC